MKRQHGDRSASRYKVTSSPYVQDLEYVAASSRREGTSTTGSTTTVTPTATTTTTVAPTATTTTTVAPTATTAATAALTPLADGYVNEAAKGSTYGSSSSLSARRSLGLTSYLRFALPPAPAGKTLVKAVLRTRTAKESFAGSADTQRGQKAGNSWSESTLTWNNRPTLVDGTLGTVASTAGPGTVRHSSLDPAALRSNLGQQVTLALVGGDSDSTWFWSREHANQDYCPQLELTFG